MDELKVYEQVLVIYKVMDTSGEQNQSQNRHGPKVTHDPIRTDGLAKKEGIIT
jgi:hypothetical protein